MQATILSIKSNRHYWEMSQQRQNLSYVLTQIEQQLLIHPPSCMIPITQYSAIKIKPVVWWQQQACHYVWQNKDYYYAIELLGQDGCAVINKIYSATYYRINLFTISVEGYHHRWLLQSTVARPEKMLACQEKIHRVKIGEQMRREL